MYMLRSGVLYRRRIFARMNGRKHRAHRQKKRRQKRGQQGERQFARRSRPGNDIAKSPVSPRKRSEP